jgi:hypothetical protein
MSGRTTANEMAAQMQYFKDVAVVRSLRRAPTFEEFKAEHGID